MSDELDRSSGNVASPSGEGETPAPVGGDSAGCRPEHGLRTGAGGIGEAPESAGPDRTTRYLDTAKGVLSYSQLAPLLAFSAIGRLDPINNVHGEICIVPSVVAECGVGGVVEVPDLTKLPWIRIERGQ